MQDHELPIEYPEYPTSAPLWFVPSPSTLGAVALLGAVAGVLLSRGDPIKGVCVGVAVPAFAFGWWFACRFCDEHSFQARHVPGTPRARQHGCICPSLAPGPERLYELDSECPVHRVHLDQQHARMYRQAIAKARHELDLRERPPTRLARRERYEGYDWGASDGGDGGG